MGEAPNDIKHVGWCDLMRATFTHDNIWLPLTLIQNIISCARTSQIVVMEITIILWASWININ